MSGYINIPESGNYKFKTLTDDGFRLKLMVKLLSINIIFKEVLIMKVVILIYRAVNYIHLKLNGMKMEVMLL